jgi:hypothetical protein
LKVPDTDGVPLIVIVLDTQCAETPAGNPFAPVTPSLEIPVAPVVVCVIGAKAVLMQSVGVDDGALAVLFGFTVTIQLPEDWEKEGLQVLSLAQRI